MFERIQRTQRKPSSKRGSLDIYPGIVEQNDSREIHPAKHVLSFAEGAPRHKVKNIFRVLSTWRLCAFAGDMVFPISSWFPNFKYFWLVFLPLFALAGFSGIPAWGQSPHEAKLIEAARKERSLVWYTAMAIDTAKPLPDAFEIKYGFLKVNYIRVGTAQMINRIITETLAGKWDFDAVTVLGMDALVKRNIFAPYLSPEREAFVDDFKDPRGLWTGVYHNNVVLAYNTKLVSGKDAPKDYADLLEPQWKGKIGMDERDYTWYGTLVAVWGKEKADRYMKRLAQQEPQFRRGHALIAQLVAAGEFPLGWVYSFRVETMKQEGAPVEWIDSFNPVVVELGGIGLGAKAKNPNAGKLFIDFVLSREGQTVVRGGQRNPRNPARKDVQPPIAKMDQARIKSKRVPDEVETNLEQYAKEYREIFRIK